MYLKGFLVAIVVLFLSGCASFIADRITTKLDATPSNDIPAWVVETPLCDENNNCVTAYSIDDEFKASLKLSFTYHLEDETYVWRFHSKANKSKKSRPLNKDLVVIFGGYGQTWQSMFTHQMWLESITQKQVILIPSANHSHHFQFGLDFVAPVAAEINRRAPQNVHIVGFSMGAVAAQRVANQFDNAHLHLIAPMTDFVRSADAIWDSGKQQNLLLNLIPKDTVQQAASLVFARAKVSSKDIAIIPNMKKSQTPTFIYISEQDKITSAVDWKAYKSTNVLIHKYLQLGHIEMVALADQNLLANFAGNLLGQKISIEDAAVIGRLCHIDNKQCMYE